MLRKTLSAWREEVLEAGAGGVGGHGGLDFEGEGEGFAALAGGDERCGRAHGGVGAERHFGVEDGMRGGELFKDAF